MSSTRRRIAWVVGLGTAFLALFTGSFWFLHRQGEHSLEQLIDELRSAGEPVTLEDLRSPPIPDAANGIVALAARIAEFEKTGVSWTPPSGWSAPGAGAEALEVQEAIDQLWRGTELSEAELFGLRAWLDERAEWLTDLTTACRRDGWASTKNDRYPSLPILFFYGGGHLQSARAILAARDGEVNEAIAHTRDLFDLATALDSEPCFSQLMVWMSMQGMALETVEFVCRIGGEGLDVSSLRPFTDPAEVRERFLTGMQAERAFLIEAVADGGQVTGVTPLSGGLGFFGRALSSLGMPSHLRETLKRRNELITAVRAAPDLASVPVPTPPTRSRWNPNPFAFDIGSRMADLAALEARLTALDWR